MNNYCRKVVLSSQAYLAIVAETFAHLDTETGGIFLGKILDDVWYVLETLDPGYGNISRRVSYFEYDVEYVTHLANVRARLYKNGLKLIGLWHRHPGSFDRFSATDDETHLRYTNQNPQGAISALVNLDPYFRITMYHIAPPLQYSKVQDIVVGDSHIPNELLSLKTDKDFMDFAQYQTTTSKRKKSRFSIKSKKSTKVENQQQQEIAFQMLEYELEDYLEKQADYSYEMKMQENEVKITMEYKGQMPYYPSRIECRFVVDNDDKKCIINGEEKPFSKGVIRAFVDEFVNSKMQEFDQSATSESISQQED